MKHQSEGSVQATRLFGWELKEIRTECGYSAREFAEFLEGEGAPITSTRSVYRLEDASYIPQRYVESFKRMIGLSVFDAILKRLRTQPGYHQSRYQRELEREEERARRLLARTGYPAP